MVEGKERRRRQQKTWWRAKKEDKQHKEMVDGKRKNIKATKKWNGASHSGLFCAASHLLGSLTVDQYVDVFHSAQHVRNKRPQAIDCVEQYQFLYRLVMDFQQQNDPTYMNLPLK
ncbi:hypothetical protein LSAT2_027044 [Lamellibrachia satsuma]|nr:hypothetical protein LSAT2_027044 [Lamellibrachia satsuma]